MRVILAAGTTETALIDDISGAGATPELMRHTPSADAEIVTYGKPVEAPITPVSPTGCPTPAAVTRAVREVVDFEWTVVDAGFAEPTAAPTVEFGIEPGADIRESEAVPNAETIFERAAEFGSRLPDENLMIGETIPGGTTTALGVGTALGESFGVSSSLPTNPVGKKRTVVEEALTASDLEPGDCAGEPLAAIRAVGDPVQAVVGGLVAGAVTTGTTIHLAGGTQLVAVGALLRHAGVTAPLKLVTTSFVAADPAVDLGAVGDRFDLEVQTTDPGFDGRAHDAMERYCAGEAKEGVAMGGALSLVPNGKMDTVRDRFKGVADRLSIDPETESVRESINGS